MFATVLQLASTCLMGLLVGALLAEGALLVPYWRTLPAEQFYELHTVFGPRLYRFYAPLTIAATSATTGAAAASLLLRRSNHMGSVLAAVGALSLIGIYFAFFASANARFANGSIPSRDLPNALTQWATWHWVRVAVGLATFAATVVAIR